MGGWEGEGGVACEGWVSRSREETRRGGGGLNRKVANLVNACPHLEVLNITQYAPLPVCVFIFLVVWLFGHLVVWLFDCLVAYLFGCAFVWLYGCVVVWLIWLVGWWGGTGQRRERLPAPRSPQHHPVWPCPPTSSDAMYILIRFIKSNPPENRHLEFWIYDSKQLVDDF